MPSPLSPPPENDIEALTFPRMLQRWLDVNPVTKLDRVGSFITIPSFSVTVDWQGYSDIVAAFNYEGPNNFSLKSLSSIPISPNYMLCIMWKDSYNVTHRYAIWKNVGEVIYFDIPLYTGQTIKKNFRFEVWSTNSSLAVQTIAISFTTSVLGKIDYRWGTDFQLIGSDEQISNFGAKNFVLPSPNSLGVDYFYDSQTNITTVPASIAVSNWNTINNNQILTSPHTGNTQTSNAFFLPPIPQQMVLIEGDSGNHNALEWSGSAFTANFVACLIYLVDNSLFLIQLSNGVQIFIGAGLTDCSITCQGGFIALNENTYYNLMVDLENGQMYAYTIDGILVGTSTLTPETTAITSYFLYTSFPTYTESIGFVALSTAQPNKNDLLSYSIAKYSGHNFTVPLTFPTNSSPQSN